MLKYLIPLFVFLLAPIAHAEKYDRDYRQNSLGGIISSTEKRMEQMANDERMRKAITGATVNAEPKSSGTREIEIKKNYPIVPYDPNHPNVQKEKKAKFNVSAKAKTLAGRFGRGLNTVALGYAVAELIGEGVDWVLDPENNSVRYINPDEQYCFNDTCESSPESLCSVLASRAQAEESQRYQTSVSVIPHKITENMCTVKVPKFYNPVGKVVHPDYYHDFPIVIKEKGKEENLSLDAIAQHVINNENVTNNITNNYYFEAVNDTLVEQVEKGQHDPDIKDAVRQVSDPSTKDETTGSKDETTGGTVTKDDTKSDSDGIKFPEFCDWATVVCDWIEWTKEPLEEDDTELQIPEPSSGDDIDTNINASGSCPADVVINAHFAGRQFEFFRFQWSRFCQWLLIIKPIIIAMASFGAAKIIGGVNVAD